MGSTPCPLRDWLESLKQSDSMGVSLIRKSHYLVLLCTSTIHDMMYLSFAYMISKGYCSSFYRFCLIVFPHFYAPTWEKNESNQQRRVVVLSHYKWRQCQSFSRAQTKGKSNRSLWYRRCKETFVRGVHERASILGSFESTTWIRWSELVARIVWPRRHQCLRNLN